MRRPSLALLLLLPLRLAADDAAVVAPASVPPPAPLAAEQVVERWIERAGTLSNRLATVHHQFVRHTVVEELNSREQVCECKTKDHEVEVRAGQPNPRLVKLDGREPTPRELRREQKREAEDREKYANRADKPGGGLEYLDPKLIRRFRYELLGTELMDGRSMYVLGFVPAAEAADSATADRVLGRLRGRVWVDAEDFEAARIEADLTGNLNIGGFIAVLDDMGFIVQRRRLPDGIWVTVLLDSHAKGRKLFNRFHGRMRVEQANFQPLPREISGGGDAAGAPAPMP
jgi:hypothetical protein